MNTWLASAVILLALVAPCGWVALRRSHMEAVVALQLAATLVTLALLMLGMGVERSSYTIVPLVAAALGFVGNITFLRFLDREL